MPCAYVIPPETLGTCLGKLEGVAIDLRSRVKEAIRRGDSFNAGLLAESLASISIVVETLDAIEPEVRL